MTIAVKNIINHIVLVLDASLSMTPIANQLVKVADNQIEYLARRSKELDQETRITVYTFNTVGTWGNPKHQIDCLIYDKDVLRVPSISGLYYPDGGTPLIDATITALDDLALTPEKYGEHSFLVYVLTDGEENQSRATSSELSSKIARLPDNWTIAAFVPNAIGISEAKRFGFPKDNIAIWDANSVQGVSEMGEKIRQTTENFMVGRSQGVRGSRNVFKLEKPTAITITTKLDSLHPGQYRLFNVPYSANGARIDEFVEAQTNRAYQRGEAYYQLSKTEEIQPQKQIAILFNNKVYFGKNARDLLGLPDEHVKVKPNDYADYDIFVQSTSNNRKLVSNTNLLVLS